MRVPPKDDPEGDKLGALPRELVIAVLRENGVTVTQSYDGSYTLSHDEKYESQSFPHLVGGVLVKRLARVFEIHPLDFYYHPETGERRFKPKH